MGEGERSEKGRSVGVVELRFVAFVVVFVSFVLSVVCVGLWARERGEGEGKRGGDGVEGVTWVDTLRHQSAPLMSDACACV